MKYTVILPIFKYDENGKFVDTPVKIKYRECDTYQEAHKIAYNYCGEVWQGEKRLY